MEKLFFSRPSEFKEKFTPTEQTEYDRVAAQLLAYYQKTLNPEQRKLLDDHFKKIHEQLAEHPDVEHFEPLKNFTEQERQTIFENLGSIQLSFGCNGGCEKCGLDAIPGVRDNLPFELIEQFVARYERELQVSKPFLYWASDPLDYRSPRAGGGTHTYHDVETLFQKKLGYRPFVSTVIPKGSEDVVQNLTTIDRLSIGKNEDYLKKRGLLTKINQQGDYGHPKAIDNYHVTMLNLGAEHTEFENEVGENMGIGCFNGMLITPRGVYSVIQSLGWNPNAPQRQFVIPYEGKISRAPQVGDDVRDVLKNHVPILERSSGHLQRQTWKKDESIYQYFITQNDENSDKILFVGYQGVRVNHILSEEKLDLLINRFVIYKKACHAYYLKHVADDGALAKLALYAHASLRYRKGLVESFRINRFVFEYLSELKAAGYESDPFSEKALDYLMTKIPA